MVYMYIYIYVVYIYIYVVYIYIYDIYIYDIFIYDIYIYIDIHIQQKSSHWLSYKLIYTPHQLVRYSCKENHHNP